MAQSFNYIFIDESGDPGKPFKTNEKGEKILTGSSLFYILSAVCLDSKKLFVLENKILQVKNKYGYRNEIKSINIPLKLYKDLLNIVNDLEIKIYYRLVDKTKYKGVFAVDGKKKFHNIFDDYNLSKLVYFSSKGCCFNKAEVIIDRSDRRLLDGTFESFNKYLLNRTNTKTIKRIEHITHVNSEYVNTMQMSDLISGALKDWVTKRNLDLKKVIDKKWLIKVW